MPLTDQDSLYAWELFTRLGEAQILLPAAALVGLALMRQGGGRSVALNWALRLAAAVLLTTASKLAFIGWGLGSAALDFTGISGHTMFACAIYPVLLAALVPPQHARGRQWAAGCGAALALAVAVSRVVVHAHSASEVVAGVFVGGYAGALAWQLGPIRSGLAAWLPAVIALWFFTTPMVAPPSQTHPMVTRLALTLSGHTQPYTREQLKARGRGAFQSAGAPSATRAAPSVAVMGPLPLKRSSAR